MDDFYGLEEKKRQKSVLARMVSDSGFYIHSL